MAHSPLVTGAWSATLALRGPGGEPVDLRRTVTSHGLTELPPMRVHEDEAGFDVVLALPRGPAWAAAGAGRLMRGQAVFEDVQGGRGAGYRGPYLRTLATAVADGTLDLEALATVTADELSDADLEERLLTHDWVAPPGHA